MKDLDIEMENEILQTAFEYCGGSSEVSQLLRAAQCAVKNLQRAISVSGDSTGVHLILDAVAPSPSTSTGSERLTTKEDRRVRTILPLYSETLTTLFDNDDETSHGCANKICAVLETAQQEYNKKYPNNNNKKKNMYEEREQPSTRKGAELNAVHHIVYKEMKPAKTLEKLIDTLPAWLFENWRSHAIYKEEKSVKGRNKLSTILIDSHVYTKLMEQSSHTIASIYYNFFQAIHFASKRLSVFPSGPIKYEILTPPWLCGPVRFVGKKNRDPIYFYTEISIPRKAGVSNRRGKHLGCIVLAGWLEKEPKVREALIQALRMGGVQIDGRSFKEDESAVPLIENNECVELGNHSKKRIRSPYTQHLRSESFDHLVMHRMEKRAKPISPTEVDQTRVGWSTYPQSAHYNNPPSSHQMVHPNTRPPPTSIQQLMHPVSNVIPVSTPRTTAVPLHHRQETYPTNTGIPRLPPAPVHHQHMYATSNGLSRPLTHLSYPRNDARQTYTDTSVYPSERGATLPPPVPAPPVNNHRHMYLANNGRPRPIASRLTQQIPYQSTYAPPLTYSLNSAVPRQVVHRS